MSRSVIFAALLLVTMLAGCTPARPPICPGPQIVEVERVTRVPVPSRFTEPCKAPAREIETNEDLLLSYREHRAALEACEAQMGEIRRLK